MACRERSPPRELPTDVAAEVLPAEQLLDEEGFSWYDPEKWYPVRIGDVIKSKFQVLVKLGFGSVSTAWLCRDLECACSSIPPPQTGVFHLQELTDTRLHSYITLKIYETGHRQASNEYKISHHLQSVTSAHPGRQAVRFALYEFELPGRIGPHVCLVYPPLGLSLKEVCEIAGGKLPMYLVKSTTNGLLHALDFLHSEAKVVHTDIQRGNVLFSVEEESFFDQVVEEEWAVPNPCKVYPDRTIYASTNLDIPDEPGGPVLTDFGDAQLGEGPFAVEVMPDLYRAPEIALRIAWGDKIDIWALGLMIWDLVEGQSLFKRRLPSREASCAPHIARMIEILGPPPMDLLKRGVLTEEFFDEEGKLKTEFEKQGGTLEEEMESLEGTEKDECIRFLRRMLQWRPEDRASARELIQDPWFDDMAP